MQTSFLSKISDDKDSSRELAPQPISEEQEFAQSVFKYWKGTNQFLFNGRVVLGPRDEMFFPYLFLVVLAIITFSFYTIILPTLQKKYHAILGLGFFLCMLLMLVFYILTAITEPGYLPHHNILNYPPALNMTVEKDRVIYNIISGNAHLNNPYSKEHYQAKDSPAPIEMTAQKGEKESPARAPEQEEIDAKQARLNLQLEMHQLQANQISQTESPAEVQKKEVTDVATDAVTIQIENFKEARRFCLYCKIYKLENTSHCVKCNCCVRVFNHHCMLVNNCIGKRNYKYFILLTFFGFVLNLYFVAGLVLYYENSGSSANFLYRLLFFLTVFQGIIIFCFCIYYLVNFLIFQGHRRNPKESEKIHDLSERNDICSTSSSLVDFTKSVDVEDAHLIEKD